MTGKLKEILEVRKEKKKKKMEPVRKHQPCHLG